MHRVTQLDAISLGQLTPLILPQGRHKEKRISAASLTQGGRLPAPSSRSTVRKGLAGIFLLPFGTYSALSPVHSQSTLGPRRGVLLGSCLALPSKVSVPPLGATIPGPGLPVAQDNNHGLVFL